MSTLERRLPWIIIALAAVAGLAGLWAGQRFLPAPPGPGMQAPALRATLLYPQPRALPAFALTRSDGRALDQSHWTGSWRLLFFGFTHCPDVCPTTLSTIKAALSEVRKQRPNAKIAVSFVSIDPERDGGETLGRYVAFFDPGFEAATGSAEQLLALTQALGVVYMKTPTGPGALDYTLDHTASILLIDPQGRLAGLMRPPHEPAAIASDLVHFLDLSPES